MSKIRTVSAIVLATIAVSSTAAMADGYRFGWGNWGGSQTPGIDRRQAEQSQDINRGIRNGQITGREAADLRAEQARIAEMERRAKADGIVTRGERQVIRGAQENAQRHIYQESHDRDSAGGRPSRRWW